MSTGPVTPGNLGRWIIIAIIVAACIAVAIVALNAFNIAVPSFVITIGWILVVCFVAIAAIKFLLTLF